MKVIRDLKSLWRHKAYRRMLIARSISRFGDCIDVVAFSWLVYRLTGSAILLGAIYTVNILPNMIFGPLIGPLVNRLDKKKLVVIADLVRGSLVVIVASLFYKDLLEAWHLFAFTFLTSTVEVFAQTAKSSLYQLSLPSEDYGKANALGGTITQISQLMGYGFAGLVLAKWGLLAAMFIDALTFYMSFAIILVTLLPKAEVDQDEKESYLEELKSGFGLVRKDKTLISIMFLAIGLNFFITPVNAMLPLYVSESLKTGAQAISFLSIAITTGLILGGLVVNHLMEKVSPYDFLITSLYLIAIFYAGLVLPVFLPQWMGLVTACVLFFIIGILLPFSNIVFSTYVMKKTPNKYIGHVSGFVFTLVMLANPLGASVFGFIGDRFNIGLVFAVNGIIMLLYIMFFSVNKHVRLLKSYPSLNAIEGHNLNITFDTTTTARSLLSMKAFNVENLKVYKILFDPLRQKITAVLRASDQAMTVQEIAKQLDIPHSKIHYHMKKLEEIEAVAIDHTEVIKGITAKYYRINYEDINFTPSQEDKAYNQAMKHETLKDLKQQEEELFKLMSQSMADTMKRFEDKSKVFGMHFLDEEIYLTFEERGDLYQLVADYLKDHRKKPEDLRATTKSRVSFKMFDLEIHDE